ncbi:FMN-dependent dehydrogenase domain containing protein, partial [Lactarius tabidus]
EALEKWRMIPCMIRNATDRNLEVIVFFAPSHPDLTQLRLPRRLSLAPSFPFARGARSGRSKRDGELATTGRRATAHVDREHGNGHRWYQLYWYFLWPRSNDVTPLILRRAKAAGFATFVITSNIFLIGWRPHNLGASYLPFIVSGTSDPVFMQRMGVPLRPDERSCFPLDLDAFCKCLAAGDEEAKVVLKLGGGWFQEMASGRFLTWEDLGFLRDNWDRSILLKGLQTVEDEHATIDVRMDGTVNS